MIRTERLLQLLPLFFSFHSLCITLLTIRYLSRSPNIFSHSAEPSAEEKLAQMLNDHQHQMLQNQAREAQHRQMLIATTTPAPRGGLTMGTPIGIVRREEAPTVAHVAPVAVQTQAGISPKKQNSNPSMILAPTVTIPPLGALGSAKVLDQPSSSKDESESMTQRIESIINENSKIIREPVSRSKLPTLFDISGSPHTFCSFETDQLAPTCSLICPFVQCLRICPFPELAQKKTPLSTAARC